MKSNNSKLLILVLIFFVSFSAVIATILLENRKNNPKSVVINEHFTEPIEILTHLKPTDDSRKLSHIKATIVIGTGGQETYQILIQNKAHLKQVCINFFNELTEKQVNDLMKDNDLKVILETKIEKNFNVKTNGVYFQEILIN